MTDSGEHNEAPQTEHDINREPAEDEITAEEYADAKRWLEENYPDTYVDIDRPFEWQAGSYVVDAGSYTDIRSPASSPASIQAWDLAAKTAVRSFLEDESASRHLDEASVASQPAKSRSSRLRRRR